MQNRVKICWRKQSRHFTLFCFIFPLSLAWGRLLDPTLFSIAQYWLSWLESAAFLFHPSDPRLGYIGRSTGSSNPVMTSIAGPVPRVVQITGSLHPWPTLLCINTEPAISIGWPTLRFSSNTQVTFEHESPLPSTNRDQHCIMSVIVWELVFSIW